MDGTYIRRIFLIFPLFISACINGGFSTPEPSVPVKTCKTVSGTAWSPSVTGAGSSNHDDGGITVATSSTSGTASLAGYAQTVTLTGANVFTHTINVASDLGTAGSISLTAEVTSAPSGSSGEIYPLLVSITDPVGNEYVNLAAACLSGGLLTAGCSPSSPSAFQGSSATERKQQWLNQIVGSNFISTVSFPTCNWGSGTPSCAFNSSSWFSSGKLRTGTYTAKFIPVDYNTSSFGSTKTVGLKISQTLKTDSDGGSNRGAMDLNLILVGEQNVIDSRTSKGKQNLNALMDHIYRMYFTDNTGSTNLKLGAINVIEWGCEEGGDTYATVDYTQIGTLLSTGSALVPSSTEGKAINIFLVSSIDYSGSGTILGISGGIPGAPINGTAASGLVFSSFDLLASYNSSCTGSGVCLITSQDPDFIDLGGTVVHEIGHFLGLNHPSESGGSQHDGIPDTPKCTATSGGYITHTACRSTDTNTHPTTGFTCSAICTPYSHSSSVSTPGTYCPTAVECQFNHIMWWTTKNYDYFGNGDGNIFSADSAIRMGYSPFIQ